MKHYVGLDVSNKETSVCIVNEKGNIVKEAKISTDPNVIHRYLSKTKFDFDIIGLETGSLSHWLITVLKSLGWPVICIDSRFMAAILSTNINKTDRNDARAIANAMRCNNYKEVYIKSLQARRVSCLLAVRAALVKQKNQIRNVIRGLLKTFGVKLAKGATTSIRELIKDALAFDDFTVAGEKKLSDDIDWSVFECLIVSCEAIEIQLKKLDKKVEEAAELDKVAKRLMTIDGVGPITAMTYKAVIDDPTRFKKSRSVGACLGMTPKQYSSGESVAQGKISKHGSKELRTLLHEAGVSMLTKCKGKSKLKNWGLKKQRKMGTQKAGMAVGRKMAIIMHRMWLEDKDFDRQLTIDEFFREETNLQIESENKKEKAARRQKKQRKRKAA